MTTDNCRRDDYPPHDPPTGPITKAKDVVVTIFVLLFWLVVCWVLFTTFSGGPADLVCGGHAC